MIWKWCQWCQRLRCSLKLIKLWLLLCLLWRLPGKWGSSRDITDLRRGTLTCSCLVSLSEPLLQLITLSTDLQSPTFCSVLNFLFWEVGCVVWVLPALRLSSGKADYKRLRHLFFRHWSLPLVFIIITFPFCDKGMPYIGLYKFVRLKLNKQLT